MSSAKLNIYMSDGVADDQTFEYAIDFITAKMMCMPFEHNFVYMPILHSLEMFNE